ncbi:TatD family hydrolase [Pseudoalteromonas xiamenensis]|uniref:TatD family hydrolase n=1 Tax=Pseudoalteromonas xiamenensis TaxID=882626 RepID=A0A975DE80_9GAMM|nr:TatD family hydrolase [Pseudoalteromonas xiamenensis]QTH70198.1 TatD family hydrolase [Pseudoalteromonas xiamenensis]
MPVTWVDIAVNLSNHQFADDVADVIARAKQADVHDMLLVGCDEDSSRAALEFAQQYQLHCTAGVHPHDAKSVSEHYLDVLESLLKAPQCLAVGECGLDFNRDFSPRPVQQQVLSEQLALAAKLDLPVYLHDRDASETLLAILKEHNVRGVLHCFTGDQDALERYLDLGLYIGITGWVCDERRGQALQAQIPLIPDDRILLETDAPFLIPRTLTPKPKSRRNEPAYLIEVAKQVALLKNISLDDLKTQCYDNFVKLFGVA